MSSRNENDQTGPPQRTLLVFGPPSPPPRPLPLFRQLLVYALPPLVSFGSIFLIGRGAAEAMLAAGMVAGMYWYAFYRLNPRLVGLALIPLILVPYYAWTERLADGVYPTLWMAASALGGGAGAWLTRHKSNEDDMIFIPPAVCAGAFVLLLWLGVGGQTREVLGWADRKLDALSALMLDQNAAGNPLAALPEFDPELGAQRLPLLLTVTLTGVWGLSIWLFGRMARRLAGCAEGPRNALILFRMHARYIFLLIAALLLAILGSLPGWRGCSYVGWPLLAIVAMAFLFQGLGVVLFFAALRRAEGRAGAGTAFAVAGFTALIFFAQSLVILGLVDHWFDFRKLNRAQGGIRIGQAEDE